MYEVKWFWFDDSVWSQMDFYDTLITWVDPVWSQMICWCSSIAVVIQLMMIPSSSERIFDCAIDLSGLVEGHLIVSNKIE